MAIEIKVPAAGESITTANIAQWHKSSGEAVTKGEALVSLETDKVSTELEAEADGILEIKVGEGEEVAIGTVIGKLEEGKMEGAEEKESKPDEKEERPEGKGGQRGGGAGTAATGAPVDVVVPAAGESITSANVAEWRKTDGDHVEKGEILVTLETDKVSNELEAPVGGVLKIFVPEGEEVAIGKTIASITPGVAAGQKRSAPTGDSGKGTEEPKEDKVPGAEKSKTEEEPKAQTGQKPDLSVVPSPPVREEPAAESSDGRTTRKKMSMLRRKIATHLVNAQQTAAILTTFNEVDMTEVMELRKSVQEDFIKKHGVKLGFMSFFVKAVTQALKDVPSINGRIDGTDVIQNHFYDIGVAIGTEKGLIVPVLRDCDKKSFAEIEKGIIDYANRGKEGKITIDDLTGGVFTISNGGTYGSLLSTPILNPPQSGILGMHTIQKRPVALADEVVIRPMMYLALSYDHRLVDGKEAVTFLIRIKDALEAPHRLLLDI